MDESQAVQRKQILDEIKCMLAGFKIVKDEQYEQLRYFSKGNVTISVLPHKVLIPFDKDLFERAISRRQSVYVYTNDVSLDRMMAIYLRQIKGIQMHIENTGDGSFSSTVL